MPEHLRRAAVAGSWYPGTRARIEAEVEGYLQGVSGSRPKGRILGLISPHAGLRYSGPVAAHGYGLLRGAPACTVVMVGPSHRAIFDGVALWARGAFETPLGRIPIDEELTTTLLQPPVVELPDVHLQEHSLEMQLPFLQSVMPGLRLVPLLMGSQDRASVEALAGVMERALAGRRDVLLVASSDLSHYHPAAIANRLDGQVVSAVDAFDAEALMTLLEGSPHHACGGGPMVAVMRTAQALGARQARVLRYADSGDAGEHDKSRVVGYLSAALLEPEPA